MKRPQNPLYMPEPQVLLASLRCCDSVIRYGNCNPRAARLAAFISSEKPSEENFCKKQLEDAAYQKL